MKTAQWTMNTELGEIYLVATDRGLCGLFWKLQSEAMIASLQAQDPCCSILRQAVSQIESYLKGQRRHFDVPLDLKGTDFQRKVWHELQRVPYGATASYQNIARSLNMPGATRAVGTANAKNPISIIVPCHRVIHSNGSLGGYAGGLAVKSKLLDLEIKRS